MFSGMVSAQSAPAPADKPAEKAEAVSPEQLKKDISYYLGLNSGMQLSEIPTLTEEDIDMEVFAKGISAGMKGNLPTKEEQASIEKSLNAFQEQISARIQQKAAKNLEEGKKFLEENAKKEGIVKTDSGLQYKIEKKGEGKQYSEKDYKNPVFKVKYKGTKIDGSVFDESGDTAIDMPLQVIPGFGEALKMMPVGSKWTLYIPSDLAYMEQGAGSKIGPNEVLIFDLELEGIEEGPEQGPGGAPAMSMEELEAMLKAQGIDVDGAPEGNDKKGDQ